MPGTASYKRLYRKVGVVWNALDLSTYLSATPTLNDRRRPVEGILRDRIVAGDVFVQKLICASAKNSHRARFMDYSAELADGDKMPDHYGPIGEVVIKKHSAAAGFEVAREAELDQIIEWRRNLNNIFGAVAHDAADSPLSGYFKEVGIRIRFTGYRAKVEIANITVPGEADNPPTLYSPDAYEDLIEAHATSEGFMEGDDLQELEKRRAYVKETSALILAGAAEVPPLQR